MFGAGCDISAAFSDGVGTDRTSAAFGFEVPVAADSPRIFMGCRAMSILIWSSVLRSRGWPGFVASASCLAANGRGFGGAASLAKTCREVACGGGAEAGAPAFIPRTLVREGASDGAVATEASCNSFAGTCTAAFATGCELVSTAFGTAVTAPGTV